MKKNIMSVIFMSLALLTMQMSCAFTPTEDDWKLVVAVSLVQGWAYMNHQQQIQNVDNNIDFCIANNAHIYTSEARQFIQQCVESCGVTASVIAISGWIIGDKEEISFAIISGKDNVFYINIPFAWIYFLNDVLTKLNNNEALTHEESTKLNSLSFLIAHEMNHVKKIMAGTSVVSRTYPLRESVATMALIVGAQMYLEHECNISYLQQLPLNVLLACGLMAYRNKKHCDEEYACDTDGINDIEALSAGKEWMLTDCKKYVEEFFAKKSSWIHSLYQKYPNALCSFFTNHPHPDARAQEIEKKIAQLEVQNANTQEVA